MSPDSCHKSTFILFCKVYSLDLVIISSYLTNTWRNLIFEIIDKHWRFIISDAVSIFRSGAIVASVMTLTPLQRVSCCSWRCYSHHSDASSCYTLRVDILILLICPRVKNLQFVNSALQNWLPSLCWSYWFPWTVYWCSLFDDQWLLLLTRTKILLQEILPFTHDEF